MEISTEKNLLANHVPILNIPSASILSGNLSNLMSAFRSNTMLFFYWWRVYAIQDTDLGKKKNKRETGFFAGGRVVKLKRMGYLDHIQRGIEVGNNGIYLWQIPHLIIIIIKWYQLNWYQTWCGWQSSIPRDNADWPCRRTRNFCVFESINVMISETAV